MQRQFIIGIIIISVICLSIGVFYVLMNTKNSSNNLITEIGKSTLSYAGTTNITWYANAAFQIKTNDLVIYIDPDLIPDSAEKADIIINTHHHGDHLSEASVKRIATNETILYTPNLVSVDGPSIATGQFILQLDYIKEIIYIKPGDIIDILGVTLEFVHSYNIDKYDSATNQLWHPPEANWTGVIIDFGTFRVYHTGDSDHIPEMKQINCTIALIPVPGVAMMTASEAVEAIESLKINSDLKCAVPMHYIYPIGLQSDAEYFAKHADCKVILLDPMSL